MKSDLKVIAISSFPTIGNAGLKNMMSILGTHLIPVPTLLITGLGNMEGHKRLDIPFRTLLDETLGMARRQGYKLILYVGYLNHPEQVDIILQAIEKYADLIRTIIFDPVCGDNGKAYVNEEIIDRFPELLNKADWALPNETEVRILTGFDFDSDLTSLQNQLLSRYPALKLITTGIKKEEEVSNHFLTQTSEHRTAHKWVDKAFSGTGDAFAALFILFHFFKEKNISDALNHAGEMLYHMIKLSSNMDSKELIIDSSILSDLLLNFEITH